MIAPLGNLTAEPSRKRSGALRTSSKPYLDRRACDTALARYASRAAFRNSQADSAMARRTPCCRALRENRWTNRLRRSRPGSRRSLPLHEPSSQARTAPRSRRKRDCENAAEQQVQWIALVADHPHREVCPNRGKRRRNRNSGGGSIGAVAAGLAASSQVAQAAASMIPIVMKSLPSQSTSLVSRIVMAGRSSRNAAPPHIAIRQMRQRSRRRSA